jgi:DNA-binding NarL/FixJ family response regulator
MNVSSTTSAIRPLERAVLRHADAGASTSEIAWRFRRSPRHIQRVIDLTRIPRSAPEDRDTDESLRPVERCIMNARTAGCDYPEIASRLRRSPEFVARVEAFATYKLRDREETSR